MTYATLSLCFIGAAVILALALPALLRRPRPHLAGMGATVAALILLTAIFDNVMIAAGLFHYAPAHLLGLHIGLAPIEDFAYPLAGALLLPAVWTVLRARRPRDGRTPSGEDARS